jgi:hypothetical protein
VIRPIEQQGANHAQNNNNKKKRDMNQNKPNRKPSLNPRPEVAI